MPLPSLREHHHVDWKPSADEAAGQSPTETTKSIATPESIVQPLLETWPNLPDDLAASEYAPVIERLLQQTVSAHGRQTQLETELTQNQQEIQTLTQRLARAVQTAREDIQDAQQISASETKTSEESSIAPSPSDENLPVTESSQETRREVTPDEELGTALAALGEPTIHQEPPGVILEEAPQTNGLTWVEILGPYNDNTNQTSIKKTMTRLIENIAELRPYKNNVLDAIQKLADLDEDELWLNLREEFKEDGRSVKTIARFLSLYYRLKTGEFKPWEELADHARLLMEEKVETLLPAAQSTTTETPPDEEISPEENGEENGSDLLQELEAKEKENSINFMVKTFRLFYEGVQANNFSVHWPVDAGRLAVAFGKLKSSFIDKALQDFIIRPGINERGHETVTELDALRLFIYRIDKKLLSRSPKDVRKKLEELTEYYSEAREIFAAEYRAKTGKDLPDPGL